MSGRLTSMICSTLNISWRNHSNNEKRCSRGWDIGSDDIMARPHLSEISERVTGKSSLSGWCVSFLFFLLEYLLNYSAIKGVSENHHACKDDATNDQNCLAPCRSMRKPASWDQIHRSSTAHDKDKQEKRNDDPWDNLHDICRTLICRHPE